jgi:pantoate--beta-alanine ligase
MAVMETVSTPNVLHSATAMQQQTLRWRRDGLRIGLVPTMGALHAGHLSLVEAAKREADVVVATIFVNPTQFAPHEDFSKYPRTLDSDLRSLATVGCDCAFVPAADEVYPAGFSTYVDPPDVAKPLEGVCRRGHFRGVATVVLKLFNLVPADVACFGQKDFQQALVIQRMTADLNLPIHIAVCPIIRDPDGLAMSSRNRYLSADERKRALSISAALRRAEAMVAAGEVDASRVRAAMHETLLDAVDQLDYASIADRETLEELTTIDRPAVALIAARVGTTRLIDNVLLPIAAG